MSLEVESKGYICTKLTLEFASQLPLKVLVECLRFTAKSSTYREVESRQVTAVDNERTSKRRLGDVEFGSADI